MNLPAIQIGDQETERTVRRKNDLPVPFADMLDPTTRR
jgi:hypothetical protein